MASSTEPDIQLLSPVAEAPRSPSVWGPLLGWGGLAGFVFVIHTLLLPGLRGAGSGLSEVINTVALLDALLTQFLCVGGVILAVHLELTLLRSNVHWLTKALSIPFTTALLLLLINASIDELAVVPLIAAGSAASFLVLGAGLSGVLRNRRLDDLYDAFLVVLGLTAAVYLSARTMAWHASLNEALVQAALARWLVTSAWALSAALTAAVIGHLVRTCSRPPLALLLIVGLPLLVCVIANQPLSYDAASWQVFVNRAVRGVLRAPPPFVPGSFVALEHLVGLATALWALAHRGASPRHRIVLGLGLLALRAPDTPLLALALLLAALASPLDLRPHADVKPG